MRRPQLSKAQRADLKRLVVALMAMDAIDGVVRRELSDLIVEIPRASWDEWREAFRGSIRVVATHVFRSVLGAAASSEGLAHARKILDEVIPNTGWFLINNNRLTVEDLSSAKRVPVAFEWLTWFARTSYRIDIELRWKDGAPTLAYAKVSQPERRLLEHRDLMRWGLQLVMEERLLELEWLAAGWWFSQRACQPDGPPAAEAMFDRLLEWFLMDRSSAWGGVPPIDEWLSITGTANGALGASAYLRSLDSSSDVWIVRGVNGRILTLESMRTAEQVTIDDASGDYEPAVGDYVFGRLIPSCIGGERKLTASEARRRDLSPGCAFVTISDETRRAALVRWIESPDPTLDQAVVVELALRIATGHPMPPAVGGVPPVLPGQDARAVLREFKMLLDKEGVGKELSEQVRAELGPDADVSPTMPDVVVLDWIAALEEA